MKNVLKKRTNKLLFHEDYNSIDLRGVDSHMNWQLGIEKNLNRYVGSFSASEMIVLIIDNETDVRLLGDLKSYDNIFLQVLDMDYGIAFTISERYGLELIEIDYIN